MSRTLEDHRQFMQSPDVWVTGRMLPLKAGPDGRLGLLAFNPLHERDVAPTVYLANLYEGIGPTTPRIQYPDWEALLDDGWLVD